MRILVAGWLLALLMLAASGWGVNAAEDAAGHVAECRAGVPQIERDFPLPRVARAIAAKRLKILVLGAGSSSLPGPNGAKVAYPARLQSALREQLPGVAVTVTSDVKSHRLASAMVKTLGATLLAVKPDLMIWQTGTIDAMLAVDPDQFSAALNEGINIARSAGTDVVLVNAQYSPRTESMIALAAYTENTRWVALQQEIPQFDRFSVMKTWADLGIFDLQSAKNKLDIAERVHDCIGRLLADLVIEAAKPSEPPAGAVR
jgi:hypothetical protein